MDSVIAGRPESLISARAGLGLDSITEFPSSKPFREALLAGLYTRPTLDCTNISFTMMARRVCIWHRVLDEYVCEAMCIACMDSEGADMRACTKAGKVEVQPGCSNGT